METSTAPPRLPKQDKDVWGKIERMIKVTTQGVALVGIVWGGFLTVISYGGKAFEYIAIGIDAIKKHQNNDVIDKEVEETDSEESNIDTRPEYYRLTRRGNQLYKLGIDCGMTPDEIEDLNPKISNPDLILAGITKVRLKGKRYYNAQEGEPIRSIAIYFKVSSQELKEANHLKGRYIKKPRRLIIPNHISGR